MLSDRAKTWLADLNKRRTVAKALRRNEGTIRSYLTNRVEPSPGAAAGLIRLAAAEGLKLTYVDFFGDPLTRPIELKKEAQP